MFSVYLLLLNLFNLALSLNVDVGVPTNTIQDNYNLQLAICQAKELTINVNCGIKQSNVLSIPNRAKGGIITLKAGTYILQQIYLYSNIIIKGAGMGITILKLQDRADSYYETPATFNNGQSGLLRALEEDNIEIHDLTIDMNKHNQIDYLLYRYDNSYINNDKTIGKKYMKMPYQYGRFALYTETCNNVKFINLEGKNAQNYGFDPHGEGGSVYKDYSRYGTGLLIENCYVHDNDWDGITIDKSRDVIVKNNIVINNGRHGINIVTGSYNVQVFGNDLSNNGKTFLNIGKGCGIMAQNNQLYDIFNLDIHNNIIKDSAYGGICLNSVFNSKVYQNTIENHLDYCMRLNVQTTNYQMLFEGLVLANAGPATTTDNNQIYNNICNNNNYGVLIRKGLSNTFTSNSIHTIFSSFGVENIDEEEALSTNKFITNTFSGKVLLNVAYGDSDTALYLHHPNEDEPADKTCIDGIINKNICCEYKCGTCGGINCTGLCCTEPIKNINWSCDTYASPCVIQPKVYPVVGADPTCANGVLSGNKKYCCETGCSFCGGTGCGSISGMCCASTITALNVKCTDYASPCLM